MTDYEKIEEIARKNNNVFKTQMVIEAGIRKEKIREMLESGLIEKLGHGLYSLSKEDVDEYYEFQQRCPKDLYGIGIVEVISPQGAKIRVYDRERTICDLIRDRKKVDMQLYSNALNVYFKSREKNIRKLMKYGKAFRITEELEKYMEVLQ